MAKEYNKKLLVKVINENAKELIKENSHTKGLSEEEQHLLEKNKKNG